MKPMEFLTKRRHPPDELVARLPIMMNMHLHVRDSLVNHFSKRLQEQWMIFLLRIKEGVLRWPPSIIAGSIRGDFRPALSPAVDLPQASSYRCFPSQGLEVIGYGQPHSCGATPGHYGMSKAVDKIGSEPELSMARELHVA